MKCPNCDAELQDGVLFCRECGSKVENRKLFCRECGAKIPDGAKFCSECGANVNAVNDIKADTPPVQKSTPVTEVPTVDDKEAAILVQENQSPNKNDTVAKGKSSAFGDKIKAKAIESWNSLDVFCKIVTVASAVVMLLLLVAIFAHKGFAIAFSVLQIAGLVVATLMHKEIIKAPKQYLKYIVLAVAIVFTVLNIMSYSWGTDTPSVQTPPATNEDVENTPEEIDWANITLSNMLPEPHSNLMDILYNGEDWLNINIYNLSENDFLEYVRWCKEEYGFTVDSDSATSIASFNIVYVISSIKIICIF